MSIRWSKSYIAMLGCSIISTNTFSPFHISKSLTLKENLLVCFFLSPPIRAWNLRSRLLLPSPEFLLKKQSTSSLPHLSISPICIILSLFPLNKGIFFSFSAGDFAPPSSMRDSSVSISAFFTLSSLVISPKLRFVLRNSYLQPTHWRLFV